MEYPDTPSYVAPGETTPEETDAGPDAGTDAGPDAGPDAGSDAGPDAGPDAGSDTHSIIYQFMMVSDRERIRDIDQFLRTIMRTINRGAIEPGDDILNQLFHQDIPTEAPLDPEYLSTLDPQTATSEFVDIACSVCLEDIKEGEPYIALPCDGGPHYFHYEGGEDSCPGIVPWFQVDHRCPVCRHEYPKQTDEPDVDEPDVDEPDVDEPDVDEPDVDDYEAGLDLEPDLEPDPHLDWMSLLLRIRPLPVVIPEPPLFTGEDIELQYAIERSFNPESTNLFSNSDI
jgi:hypothetical protein